MSPVASNSGMRVEVHTFRTPDSEGAPKVEGLWVSAKRYTTPTSTSDTKGLTLLFTHCNGSHKEEWDLVIARLFAVQATKDNESVRIREAWSFDRQNHGDAAVLNARALEQGRHGAPSCTYPFLLLLPLDEWALALQHFVQSPLVKGHRLAVIGHSAGATAWMLTARNSPPYAAIFLVEPTITIQHVFERELAERMEYMDLVVNLTLNRRFEWKSKDDAFAYFKKRLPWAMWDERALKTFVDHGLHPSPDLRRGVTLKWTKEQEAASYPDTKPHYDAALEMKRLSGTVPIHLVWGARVEFMPEYLRDCLSDPKEGMHVASVSYIEDAGHMVVQEKPDALADVIAGKLDILGACKGVLDASRAKL